MEFIIKEATKKLDGDSILKSPSYSLQSHLASTESFVPVSRSTEQDPLMETHLRSYLGQSPSFSLLPTAPKNDQKN